jgi:hypothetical protein
MTQLDAEQEQPQADENNEEVIELNAA